MLRTAIVSCDELLVARLTEALGEIKGVAVVRTLNQLPNMVDLVRFLRAAAPQAIFLGFDSVPESLEVAQRIQTQSPGTQIVAVNQTCDKKLLLETMRGGIREFLTPPFELQVVMETLRQVSDRLEREPLSLDQSDCVYAFLPAKPGVGATTLAVNTSLALARQPDTNVLLIDFDLTCGIVGFSLQIDGSYCLVDAAENAFNIDENMWPKLVSNVGKLDVLPAGKFNPGFRIEDGQARHLMDFARRQYRAVCADLSGLLEKYSIEVMQEAKQIFLVCTPEIPSLHLARERINYLRGLDLGERVALLLNRALKRHVLSQAEMEKLFGVPVYMKFPNDYPTVHKAMATAKMVDLNTELGRQIQALAQTISSGKPTGDSKKRSWLDALNFRKSQEASGAAARGGVLITQ
jgi:pilus assembly protein CpaE